MLTATWKPGLESHTVKEDKHMSAMATVYANLIRKGKKTLDNVPEALRAEVEALLAEED